MRALSIRQPWAHALLYLGKDVENRAWRFAPSYAGPLLIHAGKAKPTRDDRLRVEELAGGLPLAAMPLGGFVGVVLLGKAHHAYDCPVSGAGRHACSRWAEQGDVWHLPVSDPHPFAEVVPAQGQLGFWRPSSVDGLLEALREAGVQP